MITAFYTAARIVLMVSGWLVALALALAADYMLTGAKWPIFIGLGSWWTLTCIIYVRNEAERSRLHAPRRFLWRRAVD
jgi:hypothetical protein